MNKSSLRGLSFGLMAFVLTACSVVIPQVFPLENLPAPTGCATEYFFNSAGSGQSVQFPESETSYRNCSAPGLSGEPLWTNKLVQRD